LRSRYLANKNLAGGYRLASGVLKEDAIPPKANPFYPRFWEDRLSDRGLFQEKPRGIFPCDMSDLFGIGVPEDWTDRVIDQIKVHQQHRFYLLTKQPQNLPKSPSYFPDNCWVGVTATNNTSLDKAMLGLADIVASKRYISFEPLLLPVNFSEEDAELLDWVIIGAQTKSYKPPKIEWVQEIVEACDKAGVKVFLKDNLLELVNYESPETDFAFNEDGCYRQEMPNRQEMPL